MQKPPVTTDSEKKHEEAAYRYWLFNVPGIGDKTAALLWKQAGGFREIYKAEEGQLKEWLKGQRNAQKQKEAMIESKKAWQVFESYDSLIKKGIQTVGFWDEEYPKRLKELKNPPLLLYYLGRLPDEKMPSLALIGARDCSDYGAYVAKAFGSRLAAAGVSVVSGMARGIDGIGQLSAVQEKGSTYAVLGCGVDICYPASHRSLYEKIQERGGILSPFPPGTPPARSLFPCRNKIVAGLGDAVLVVEARQQSGTWITVDMALEQGKDVYAVPGRLTDRLSDGCNLLIRQGAGIALSPEDVLAELVLLHNREIKGSKEKRKQEKQEKQEEQEKQEQEKQEQEKKEQEIKRDGKKGKKEAEKAKDGEEQNPKSDVLRFLDINPKSSDEILKAMQRAGSEITLPRLLFELIQLCMEGRAKQTGGNYFSKVMGEM